MFRHDFHCNRRPTIFLTYVYCYVLHYGSYLFLKHFCSCFGDPYKVIVDIVPCMSCLTDFCQFITLELSKTEMLFWVNFFAFVLCYYVVYSFPICISFPHVLFRPSVELRRRIWRKRTFKQEGAICF